MTSNSYAQLLKQVHTLGLDSQYRVRQLRNVLQHVHDESTTSRAAAEVQGLIAQHNAPGTPNPFPPPPPGLVSTRPFVVAYDASTGEPITIGPEDIASIIVLPGATSSGKTTIILLLIRQIVGRVNLWILDLKDDYRNLAVHDQRMVILQPDTPCNLLTPPAGMSCEQFDNLFVEIFARLFFLGELGSSALAWGVRRARADNDHPCLKDVARIIKDSINLKQTYQERDHKTGIVDRLERFIEAYPGPTTRRDGFGTDTFLHGHGLYVAACPLTKREEFLFTYLTNHLFLYQLRNHHRGGLDHVLIYDEGVQSWSAHNPGRITEAPPQVSMMGLSREASIGILPSTNSWATTHQALKSNANTIIITRLASQQDEDELAKTVGMSPEQAQYLNHELRVGQAIIRLRDRWRQPLLGFVPPVSINKTVDPKRWEEAKARTNLIAPPQLPTIAIPRYDHTAPRPTAQPSQVSPPAPPTRYVPHHEAPSRPDTAPTPTTTTPREAPVAAPTTPTKPAPKARPAVALNASEEALLRVVCDTITASTAAYQRAQLSRAGGDEAAKRLAQKGLITREHIVFHAGRGGHGRALAPTSAGLARAGKERPVKTRGGDSVQHQYLIQELHKALPGSTIEALVGTKAVDLLVALNTTRDAALFTFIATPAEKAGPPIALNTGSLLAIEVETSDPTKTAPANVRQNHAAGITLTLTAVLPKQVRATRDHLTKTTPTKEGFLVVDILALLDHLRRGKA